MYRCTYTAAVPDEVPEWTWDTEKARVKERFVTIGLAAEGVLRIVVWSPVGIGGRILSARGATRRERRRYEEEP